MNIATTLTLNAFCVIMIIVICSVTITKVFNMFKGD